jgi:predicted RNA-binding protein YlxR (DUF448 family)
MQRIVALPESLVSSGTLRLVFYKKGQRRGRGAWVCLDPNCLELLPKNLQKIKRAFKRDVDISALLSPTSEYASLSTQKGA